MEASSSLPVDGRFTARLKRSWVVVALGGALAVVLAAGAFLLTRSDVFHVRRIAVVGNAHLTKRQVVALSGITKRSNALWLDEGAAERRLEGSPWIARARVSLALPWSVTLKVTERRPVAVMSVGTGLLEIASDGTPLGPADRRIELPRIVAPPAPAIGGAPPSIAGAARAVGSVPPGLVPRIRRVLLGLDGTIELQVAHGPRILLGRATDLEAKGRTLSDVLAWAESEHERLSEVNLIAADAPAVVLAH